MAGIPTPDYPATYVRWIMVLPAPATMPGYTLPVGHATAVRATLRGPTSGGRHAGLPPLPRRGMCHDHH